MKKLAVLLLFVSFLCTVPLTAEAASCTQNGATVQGDVCGLVEGECICSDVDKPKK